MSITPVTLGGHLHYAGDTRRFGASEVFRQLGMSHSAGWGKPARQPNEDIFNGSCRKQVFKVFVLASFCSPENRSHVMHGSSENRKVRHTRRILERQHLHPRVRHIHCARTRKWVFGHAQRPPQFFSWDDSTYCSMGGFECARNPEWCISQGWQYCR